MELSRKKWKDYRANLFTLQDLTDKLLGHMRGYDWSYRREIADGKGNYSPEKLRAFVEELLSGWEDEVRYGLGPDPATGENLAEPYLRARRELLGTYIWLAMRCSLLPGAFRVCGGAAGERTDFAFLLEQAKILSRSWCVMAGTDGTKKNVPFEGFDKHFGLHLYSVLTDPEGMSDDFSLTPYWKSPIARLDSLTNEGAMKRIFYRSLSPVPPAAAEEPEETDGLEDTDGMEDSAEAQLVEPEDGLDWDSWYDPEEDEYLDFMENGDELLRMSERKEAAYWLSMGVEDREAYIGACQRFVSLFERAEPDVLWSFRDDLAMIVDLFLVQREISPLVDTDKTQDVYGRTFDGPYRQARRFARGIQWDSL